jgi:2-polyprenyl-3-methyl-5-hydroxy-6-metoxy-1,4-benzoquinol methylase
MLDTFANRRTHRRTVVEEMMDRPDVDQAAHRQALRGLRRINRVSSAGERLLRPILELTRRAGLKRISLLDVACGGGDVPIALALAAAKAGVSIDLTLLDRSGTAITHAAEAAARAGLTCRTVQGDVLSLASLPKVHVVTNSLFCHHLRGRDEVVGLLRAMREAADRMVVISDLRRCRLGLLAAWIGCRALSRSGIVHHDGPASVRAAWTTQEMAAFAAAAGMDDARIAPTPPWRIMLVWERPHVPAD